MGVHLLTTLVPNPGLKTIHLVTCDASHLSIASTVPDIAGHIRLKCNPRLNSISQTTLHITEDISTAIRSPGNTANQRHYFYGRTAALRQRNTGPIVAVLQLHRHMGLMPHIPSCGVGIISWGGSPLSRDAQVFSHIERLFPVYISAEVAFAVVLRLGDATLFCAAAQMDVPT
jgi:hypothetical protein